MLFRSMPNQDVPPTWPRRAHANPDHIVRIYSTLAPCSAAVFVIVLSPACPALRWFLSTYHVFASAPPARDTSARLCWPYLHRSYSGDDVRFHLLPLEHELIVRDVPRLYGLTLHQAYRYYKHYPEDPWLYPKGLVRLRRL